MPARDSLVSCDPDIFRPFPQDPFRAERCTPGSFPKQFDGAYDQVLRADIQIVLCRRFAW